MLKTIGECRLNAYQLFFERPLCQCSSNTQKVLIAGNGIQAEEVFKISLIAGQNLGKDLLVDLFSNNAEEFGKKIFDENGPFPALSKFVNNKNTTVRFKNCDFSLIEFNDYDYIIIADDNEQTNLETVNRILITSSFEKKTLIAVYCDSKDSISSEVDSAEIYVFGNQNIDNFKNSELMRLAKNINFAYAMDYKQNTSCETSDSKFMESFEKEFCTPENKFHGADYDADSSIACAMHIPYKLEFCKEMGVSNDAERILSESIIHKNRVYKNLVELEHKRWNIFMALRGFKAPIKEEYKDFHDGKNDHRNKEKMLHMCMVDFDKLDKISKLSTELASKKSSETIENKDEIFSLLNCENQSEQNLKLAIEKLFNNDTNSVKLYEDAYATVVENASDDKKKALEIIKLQLSHVVTRNKKVDFKGIDEQLIDFLPFCLWYRKKYKKVITISNRNALKDVIIPTIFCSKELIFIGKDIKNSKTYIETIKKYFDSRFGENAIQPAFEDVDNENLIELLKKEIKTHNAEEIIINISGLYESTMIVELGKFLAESPNITIVSYDILQKILVINGDENLSAGLNNKYFTAEEVIRLIGGEPINEYSKMLDFQTRETMANFFKSHYTYVQYEIVNKKGNVEKKYFNPWIKMIELFQQMMKSKKVEINPNSQTDSNVSKLAKLLFEKQIYENSGIKTVLKTCCTKKVIDGLECIENEESVMVSFEYVEDIILDKFREFEKNDQEDTKSKFAKKYKRINFNNEGIISFDLYIDKPLFQENENATIKEWKVKFLTELEETGLISELTFEDANCQFLIKDEYTRWLLITQGAIWEQIVLHSLYKYSNFSDLKLGVKFSWDKSTKNFERDIQEKINLLPKKMFGYRVYLECVSAVKRENLENNVFYGVENEIDVIGVKNMNPIFVSCKTNKSTEKNWLYEIGSVSNHFGAVPIMATTHDFDKKIGSEFVGRALQMGISLIGKETIWDVNKLASALKNISEGRIISPKMNERERYEYEL